MHGLRLAVTSMIDVKKMKMSNLSNSLFSCSDLDRCQGNQNYLLREDLFSIDYREMLEDICK